MVKTFMSSDVMITYRKAKAFLSHNFRDCEYVGDNPYLAGTTVAAMIIRWYHCDEITHEVYERLMKDYQ